MSAVRPQSRRDLPAMFVWIGCIIGAGGLLLPLGQMVDRVAERNLTSLSGTVTSIIHVSGHRGPNLVYVGLAAVDRTHSLVQDERAVAPSINVLRPGDRITARVWPDAIDRRKDWIWELRRGDTPVVPFDLVSSYYDDRIAQYWSTARYGGIFALSFFVIGIFLRTRFGAWGDAT